MQHRLQSRHQARVTAASYVHSIPIFNCLIHWSGISLLRQALGKEQRLSASYIGAAGRRLLKTLDVLSRTAICTCAVSDQRGHIGLITAPRSNSSGACHTDYRRSPRTHGRIQLIRDPLVQWRLLRSYREAIQTRTEVPRFRHPQRVLGGADIRAPRS